MTAEVTNILRLNPLNLQITTNYSFVIVIPPIVGSFLKKYPSKKMVQLQMPHLPASMKHTEEGQPVVFYFKNKKPEAAVLPVYITRKNESESLPSVTLLNSSESERRDKEERALPTKTEARTAESFSTKEGSTVTPPPLEVDTRMTATGTKASEVEEGRESNAMSTAWSITNGERVAPLSLLYDIWRKSDENRETVTN